jgi:two-component system, NtrC family, nitrogen regulation sensor histidine kinase NtrY
VGAMSRLFTGIRARLALAIIVTAGVPVAGAVFLARSLVQQASERSYLPEIQKHLDAAVGAYGELAREKKRAMRLEGHILARSPELQSLSLAPQDPARGVVLERLLERNPAIAQVEVFDARGESVETRRRGKMFDERTEVSLVVREEITPGASSTTQNQEPFGLAFTLTTSRAPFDEFEQLGEFLEAYASLTQRRAIDEQTYVVAFAVLMLGTIGIAAAIGGWFTSGISKRVRALALATAEVAKGDLSIRVAELPEDEIGQLGRAFNRMLAEVEGSRSRIEYLSRLASWQEMARRLAHEIKNPLTPIQLAVQEVHQRFKHLPEKERNLLDVTLEIVESEVLTLKRLVKEFSEFARLPECVTEPVHLRQFLEELGVEYGVALFPTLGLQEAQYPKTHVIWTLPAPQVVVPIDVQMMRRVFANLVRNAIQASIGRSSVNLWVHAALDDASQTPRIRISVEDDGPGIKAEVRAQMFEPYVTTKGDGTGLGLAIVKKVVMDHNGTIEADARPGGGARFVLSLPLVAA